MNDCTPCEGSLTANSSLALSVIRSGGGSGSDILVYAQNQGRNIIIIKRMVLCLRSNGGQTLLYIREGGFFDFEIGGERLEQGLTQLKFRITNTTAQHARVQAEHIEITGRAQSCTADVTQR